MQSIFKLCTSSVSFFVVNMTQRCPLIILFCVGIPDFNGILTQRLTRDPAHCFCNFFGADVQQVKMQMLCNVAQLWFLIVFRALQT